MQIELYIYFDGNCKEAVDFYAKVFKSNVGNVMTYGQAPEEPGNPLSEADKNRIIYAGLPVGGMVMMFSDVPAGSEHIVGNNISPTISDPDKNEITRLYNELSEGGEVLMPLGQTFFSELFGMVEDKFGIIWQITHFDGQKQT